MSEELKDETIVEPETPDETKSVDGVEETVEQVAEMPVEAPEEVVVEPVEEAEPVVEREVPLTD